VNSLAIAQTVSAVRATVARLLAEAPETDAAALLAVVEQEAPEFGDVMTALCRAADEAGADADAISERITALQDRRERATSRREAYRAAIFAALDAAGQRSWKSPEFTVSVTPGRAGVVITDPDKTAIGAALALGPVSGAELRNGLPTLTIRTK
jgi:hypothetical protein